MNRCTLVKRNSFLGVYVSIARVRPFLAMASAIETDAEPPHEHIYYMVCKDMPHLVKIGITTVPHHRLKAANKHDTYLPPSGYVYGRVLRVADSLAHENRLKDIFRERRRRNPQGNPCEFFELTVEEVEREFSAIPGEPLDVAQFDQAAEKKEMALVRRFLAGRIEAKAPCTYPAVNPKTRGSKCYERFQNYMTASSLDQALLLGSTREDVVYDYLAGFLKLVPMVDVQPMVL